MGSKIFIEIISMLFFIFLLFAINNPAIFLAMNAIYYFIIFWYYRKYSLSNVNNWIVLLIFSIPVSFISFLGQNFSQMPLSWFHIFLIILLLYIFIQVTQDQLQLSMTSIVTLILGIYLCSLLLISINKLEGIQQLFNLGLFMLVLIFLPNLKTPNQTDFWMRIYCKVVFYTAIGTLFQYFYYQLTGQAIGYVKIMGIDRLGIGYLFSDFSFISMYLASGLLIYIILNRRFYSNPEFLTVAAACLVTSARTGAVAFVSVCIAMLIIKSLKNYKKNAAYMIRAFILIPAILYGGFRGYSLIRPDDFVLSSGRIEGYLFNISLIQEQWLFGLGLGVRSYQQITGQTIPHNIFIQFLVQFGVVGLLLIIVLLTMITANIYRLDKKYLWVWLGMLIGAQFIPDILHSRFILVFLLILLADSFHLDNKNRNDAYMAEE